MLEGLNQLLAGTDQPGLAELRQALFVLLDGPAIRGRLLATRPLQPRKSSVFRLRFRVNGQVRSVIVKRLKPAVACRNHLVLRQWLPAVGLGDCGPALLGVAATASGDWVWHVYEDVAGGALNPRAVDPQRVQAVVELIARLHTRFANHPLLAECRNGHGDLGRNFYTSSVRDALNCLAALRPPQVMLTRGQSALRDRLLTRMEALHAEDSVRAQVLGEFGGPDTLLHGDLWTSNAFVVPGRCGWQARLIDWDHVGVGSYSYDLSTFLLRFAPKHRSWILDSYRAHVAAAGWRLPDGTDLDRLFETAEYARCANMVLWPALALLHGPNRWSFTMLAEVERWFRSLRPVLGGTRTTDYGPRTTLKSEARNPKAEGRKKSEIRRPNRFLSPVTVSSGPSGFGFRASDFGAVSGPPCKVCL